MEEKHFGKWGERSGHRVKKEPSWSGAVVIWGDIRLRESWWGRGRLDAKLGLGKMGISTSY